MAESQQKKIKASQNFIHTILKKVYNFQFQVF